MLLVSKDAHGTFRAHREDADLSAVSAGPATSALWHLLVDGSPESGLVTEGLLGQLTSWEVGLDLDWIERLEVFIAPDTSALLMLVEAKWANDLLDAVLRSGGFPIVFGCLERETMLLVGPDLAATSLAARAAELSAARRGLAVLDVFATAQPASKDPTQVIAALVDAGLLEECEVDAALGALAARGLVQSPLLEHARADADATISEITPLPVRSVETEG